VKHLPIRKKSKIYSSGLNSNGDNIGFDAVDMSNHLYQSRWASLVSYERRLILTQDIGVGAA
jgi:hypothetical protein